MFPHHAELAGFSVYSDREISDDFGLVMDEARHRIEAWSLPGGNDLRIFVCLSAALRALIGWRASAAGPGAVISAAGNAFFSARNRKGRNVRVPIRGSRVRGRRLCARGSRLVFAELGSGGSPSGNQRATPYRQTSCDDLGSRLRSQRDWVGARRLPVVGPPSRGSTPLPVAGAGSSCLVSKAELPSDSRGFGDGRSAWADLMEWYSGSG